MTRAIIYAVLGSLLITSGAAHALEDGKRLTFQLFSSQAGKLSGDTCNGRIAIPFDYYYQPPVNDETKWCSAVQRVFDPLSPFSPRQYLVHIRINNNPVYKSVMYAAGRRYDLRGTDRVYSWAIDQAVYTKGQKEDSSSSSSSSGGSGTSGSSSSTSGGVDERGCPIPPSSSSGDTSGGSSTSSGEQRKCNRVVQGYAVYNDNLPEDFLVKRPAVQCGIVPVDMMNFSSTRLRIFDSCMSQRIALNYATWLQWLIKDIDRNIPKWNKWRDQYSEWAASNPAIDDPGLGGAPWTPPCATRYFDQDYGCPATMSIRQCCSIITKPIVPMNALKIVSDPDVVYAMEKAEEEKGEKLPIVEPYMAPSRSGKFGWKEYVEDLKAVEKLHEAIKDKYKMQNPVPDDYRFSGQDMMFNSPDVEQGYARQFYSPFSGNFIGAYMPYMRRWDTGAQSFMGRKFGSFINTLPSYDMVVGAGREAVTPAQSKDALALARASNRPGYEIGWLQQQVNENGRLVEMGRYGGFPELVGEQALNMRYFNMMCLPNQQKTFKPFDSMNFALSKAGTYYTSPRKQIWPWPLGWRGYDTETAVNYKKGFPFLYNEKGFGTYVGLSQAQRGDIIVLNYQSPSGPFVRSYFVTEVGTHPINAGNRVPDYLYVVAWNTGKFPTATGITDQIGMGPEFMMYRDTINDTPKTMAVQGYGYGAALTQGGEPSCVDPNFSKCVVPPDTWANAVGFRPSAQYASQLGAAQGGGAADPLQSICPVGALWDTYRGAGGNMIVHADTQNHSASWFGFCINAGFDPPYQWRKEGTAGDFGGSGTGQTTFTRFCPPGAAADIFGIPLQALMGPEGAWGSCPSSLNPFGRGAALPRTPQTPPE